ncbi:hypothetical protein B0H14DRAFT_2788664 [Mycena olivaceomarginata]|nr:hypothetical protein B0H14DRAFT_2788664 [Mycena olivaceomarginata]
MHASVSVQLRIGSPVSLTRVERVSVPIHVVATASQHHEDAHVIVKKHIKLLHRYNDSKDATQLATLRETTVRQIHNRNFCD